MEAWEIVIITLTAGAGATLTAVAGLGGGIILLTVLLQFLEPQVAIPVHAVIQLASNGSRSIILRRDIRWDLTGRFAVLLLPAGFIGFWASGGIPAGAGRASIAIFALLAAWRPTALTSLARRIGSERHTFTVLGGVAGFLNIPLGVTGPAIAPFFRQFLTSRHVMVATLAAAQVLGHLTKIIIFGTDGFEFGDHTVLVTACTVSVTAGSWVGTRLLGRVSEKLFQRLFRLAITTVAARLLITSIW